MLLGCVRVGVKLRVFLLSRNLGALTGRDRARIGRKPRACGRTLVVPWRLRLPSQVDYDTLHSTEHSENYAFFAVIG